MPTPLNLLILEDRAADAELLVRELRRAGFEPEWQRVDTEVDYLACLQPDLDLILADYYLPGFDAPEALRLLQERGLDVPFIIVTGALTEEIAVACMKQGAADYLLKDRPARLGGAVEQALRQSALQREKQQAQVALRESEERFRSIFELAPISVIITDAKGQFLQANQAFQQMLGYSEAELQRMTLEDIIYPDDLAESMRLRDQLIHQELDNFYFRQDRRYQRKDGRIVWSDTTVFAIYDREGGFQHTIILIQDITERKQAEETLIKERNLLRTLIDNIPDYIYVKDNQSRFVLNNAANLQRLGAETQEQVAGKTDFDFFSQELAEQYCAGERALIQSGQPIIDREEPAVDPATGDEIWFSTTKVPLRDEQGAVTGLVAISRDITLARKQVETKLEKHAAQLALINDIGGQIAAVLELDSVLQRTARLVQESFDYHHVALFLVEGEQLRLKAAAGSYVTYFPPGHTQQLSLGINGWVASHGKKMVANDVSASPHYMSLIAKQTVTRSELCLPIKVASQTLGILDIQSPHLNAFSQSDVIAMEALTNQIAVAIENARLYEQAQQEIRERKQTEMALRESEKRYHTLAEVSPVGIFRNDVQGNCIYVNDRLCEMTGFTAPELLGQGWIQMLHPDDRDHVLDQWHTRVREKKPFQLEYRLPGVDGVAAWVLVQTRVEENSAGLVQGYVGTVTDISKRKQIEEEIVRLYEAERTRHAEAEALRQAALALTSIVDPDQVVEAILVELQKVVSYDSASVQLRQENHLRFVGGRGFPNLSELINQSFPLQDNSPNTLVFEAQEPIIIDDVWRRAPHFNPDPFAEANIRSWLGAPMRIGEQIVGLLALNKDEPGFYTQAHAQLVSTYAAQAVIAMENARLHAETQRRAQQLTVMQELDRAITASLRISDVYQAFAEHTNRLLSFGSMFVALLEGNSLRLTYVVGMDKSAVGTEFPLKNSMSGQVVTFGQALVRHHIRGDMEWVETKQLVDANIQSIMIIPLRVKRQIIGTWSVGSPGAGVYNLDDLNMAQAMADQLALAIENSRLYQQAQQEIAERKQAQADLEAERASLAQRVEERTAELSVANAQLARASRLKDEFLASMSHELRTPLNAILGMSEALQEQIFGQLNLEQLDCVQEIVDSGRHLLELITDILDLSKIEAGKADLDIMPVSVEAVCQASLRMIKQPALKKQLKISFTFDHRVDAIEADNRRLKQILVNLLSNAVKFTPSKGEIGLEVVNDLDRKIISFTIWDTGIGIAAEDLRQLFQPFVQIDRGLARQYEGTGLGLALVYRLTEMHGGGILVESKVGEGTRFTVSLPWQPAGIKRLEEGEAEENREEMEKATQRSKIPEHSVAGHPDSDAPLILLAEDNEANIHTISNYLIAKGYRVTTVRTGDEAISQAREIYPDLILMDIQMPGMNGLEAIRRLRADIELAQLPVIALTALAMPGDREKCLAAGANEYLSKPVGLKKLVKTIEKHLQRQPDGDREPN